MYMYKDFEVNTLNKLNNETTEHRIVKNQLFYLNKTLMDRTDQLNKMQENYQNQRQMNLRRQLSISI
jgi:hypothetical protein